MDSFGHGACPAGRDRHGQHGTATHITPRHAKLAVGAASTFATFLFETHEQTK